MELLSPAGSPEALDAAIHSGADAVYLGLKNFNARIRSANFTYAQFEALTKILHKAQKKIYVTVNTVFEEREADRIFQLLSYLSKTSPDALIVQDFGVLQMIKNNFPKLKIHASTQMNIASSKGCNFLSKQGVSRVVLARELSFVELKEIRAKTKVELECFVHGSLCVSVSGICLFSSYLGGKSANRGLCTQACRRRYTAHGNIEDSCGMTEREGYFFSPRDFELLEKIPLLYNAGINALKIEGRMKSAEYVGIVTAAYREVIDASSGNETQIKNTIEKARFMLRGDYARSKTIFHFDGAENKDWIDASEDGGTGIKLGKIMKRKSAGDESSVFLALDKKDAFNPLLTLETGDSLRFHKYDDSRRETHKTAFVKRDETGLWFSAPHGFEKGDSVYLIQSKASAKHFPKLLPKEYGKKHREPGFEKAPFIKEFNLYEKKHLFDFTEGLYPAVQNVSDLFIAQSIKTRFIILAFNKKNAAALLSKNTKPLPYSPEKIILELPEFFPESMIDEFELSCQKLIEKGYNSFIVNNPGQIGALKKNGAVLIAGAYLYAFNKYSASFLEDSGFNFLISPLENSRQNLEKVFSSDSRRRVFLTVYARPKLFQIASDLHNIYSFNQFSDKDGAAFHIVNAEPSFVIPEIPFSVTSKIPFLKQKGFRRFIIDFTPQPLKKVYYKNVISAALEGEEIHDVKVSRFNWKDGFWQSDK